ncbi:MAG TPA: polymer-forming cytoskeletal protein [Allosphingosinicella sp.]|jgi:cytoskeletal protein CcmA (bactofilin family)
MQNFQVRSPDSVPSPPKADSAADKAERPQMSMIGADIIITGNIEASVDLHIEGRVMGDVRCSTLILGESSIINGGIHADRVRVSGMVEGAIVTRDLAIEATARVTGEVSYERLRIANGAIVDGTLKRNAPPEASADARLKLVEAKAEAKLQPKLEAEPAVIVIE